MTPQEAKLWLHLRALRPQGYHFRRQAPLLGYYLDFVCFSHRLVIEVDGGQHAEGTQAASDARRDAVLAEAGFFTHRVWNHEVDQDVGAVVDGIFAVLLAKGPTRHGAFAPRHPPHEGEGG